MRVRGVGGGICTGGSGSETSPPPSGTVKIAPVAARSEDLAVIRPVWTARSSRCGNGSGSVLPAGESEDHNRRSRA